MRISPQSTSRAKTVNSGAQPDPEADSPQLWKSLLEMLKGSKYEPVIWALRPFRGILGTVKGTYRLYRRYIT